MNPTQISVLTCGTQSPADEWLGWADLELSWSVKANSPMSHSPRKHMVPQKGQLLKVILAPYSWSGRLRTFTELHCNLDFWPVLLPLQANLCLRVLPEEPHLKQWIYFIFAWIYKFIISIASLISNN